MGNAMYIGRVGGLALALGVGMPLATAQGTAWASTGSDSPSKSSSSSASESTTSTTTSGGIQTTNDGGTSRSHDGKPAVSTADGSAGIKPTVKNKKQGSNAPAFATGPKTPNFALPHMPSINTSSGRDSVVADAAGVQSQSDPTTKLPAHGAVVVDVAQTPPTTSTLTGSAPLTPAPQSQTTPLVSTMLSAVGLGPSAGGDVPATPVDSPILLAGLAAFRRQTQQGLTGVQALTQTAVDPQSSLTGAPNTSAGPLVTAAPLNSAPQVVGPVTVDTFNTTTGKVTGKINVVDPGGNPLSYQVTTAPTKGTVSIDAATGNYTYTPTTQGRLLGGNDTFTVTVSDGQASTTAHGLVRVLPAPVANTSSVTVGKDPASVATFGNRAYVANQYTKTVSVIDTNPASPTFNTVVGTIKLASSPSDIVLNSTGTRAYVAMKGDAKVAVIDTASNTVLTNVSVGSTPASIAISPDNSRVYVTNGGSSTVSVIDTATNTQLSRITVGSQPSGIAVSPDGTKLYVTLRYSNSLAIVNLADNTKTFVKVGNSPRDVALSADGTRAYVTNYDGTVSVIDTTTKTQLARLTTGVTNQPAGVTVGPDGTVYVANGNDTVSLIDPTTLAVTRTVGVDSTPENGAHSVTVNTDGRVFVTDYHDAALREIAFTPAPFPNTAPTVVYTSPDFQDTGTIYVVDLEGNPVTATVLGPDIAGDTVDLVNTAPGAYTYTYTQNVFDGQSTEDFFTIEFSDGTDTTDVSRGAPLSQP